MKRYYLAIDIGASSGRHILGWIEDGRFRTEEVYRFENGMVKRDGHLCWDLDRLLEEVQNGMRECGRSGRIPVSIGIDTWAVDYVLLDAEGKAAGPAYGYRDRRTEGMDLEVQRRIAPEELYRRTGIQKQCFNTIYQLEAAMRQNAETLERAEQMLLIPDYLNERLTGVRKTEYTNATTTQLVSPKTGDWDWELIDRLGFPEKLFGPITMAGTPVGRLKEEVALRVGYQTEVVQSASHDTASAVLAVPAETEDFLYISSGTWSLIGTERRKADCSEGSRQANMTNEGGYGYRFRYLKNCMGLWMIQCIRRELGNTDSFAGLCRKAEQHSWFPSRIDVNQSRFLAPDRMIEEVQEACRESGQRIPEGAGELAAVIYQSLAESYAAAVLELERLTGKEFSAIHIVGGGSQADYLNALTAEKTGKMVYCGPAEATAIGNLAVQMLKQKEFASVAKMRRSVADSFPIRKFSPGDAKQAEAGAGKREEEK